MSAPAAPRPARLGFVPLLGLVYISVCAGPYGMEDLVSASGPGLALLLILLAPLLWGIPMAMAVAELGSGWPVLGGYYRWTRTGLGDFWGFQQGWWQLLSSWCDNALYPVLVSDYLATLFPALVDWSLPLLPGLAPGAVLPGKVVVRLLVIVIFAVTNALGAVVVGRLTLVFSAILILPFVPFVVMGLLAWQHSPLTPLSPPGQPPLEALGVGILIAMWGYSGYESMSTAIHEVERPQRDFPRALFWSIPLTIVSYLLPLAAGLAAHGAWESWTSGTLADAAATIGGAWLHAAVLVGALASSMGLFNGYMLSYTRLPQAMAEDGFLPRFLARLSPRRGTPVFSIAANSAVYALLAFFDFRDLVVIDTILFALAYILIFATLVRFRFLFPAAPRPYRVPGGAAGLWLVAAVPSLVALAACVFSDFEEVRWGLAAAATGPLAYLLARALR